MKIDVFAHILPEKYFKALQKKDTTNKISKRTSSNPANTKLDVRLRVMERYPDVVQIINVSQPPLEAIVSAKDAVDLARMANDELAELVVKYPDKFIGGVACLPLNNIDAALKETDRAIKELKFKGVQIYSNVNQKTLETPKMKPLYEKMARYNLPIWIHPWMGKSGDESVFGWPYETSSAMLSLVAGGIFRDFPSIKFMIHHAGAMAPYFEQRINWLFPLEFRDRNIHDPVEHFRKFYCDTAVYGSTLALTCAYNFFGVDRLLFGTDAPLGPNFGLTDITIESIERLEIPDSDKGKIFWQNAAQLLKIAV